MEILLTEEGKCDFREWFKSRDAWGVIDSPFFPGFVQVVKSRKHKDPITVHLNPETGRVRKFAGKALYNPRIEKEAEIWETVLKVFGVNEQIEVGSVRLPRENSKKGNVDVIYLDMPYLGVPLKYYLKISSGGIPRDAVEEFIERLKVLITEYQISFHDFNDGNILVRLVDGKVTLFPIDWESADRGKKIARRMDYYIENLRKKCSKIFGLTR